MLNIRRTLLFVFLLITACKKPTENLKIVVDTDVIKDTALIHVTDAASPAETPKNATINITGSSAADIYEISGKKRFKLSEGIITIGPGPAATPLAGQADSCVVQIKAPGYVGVSQPVVFTADKKQQVINISMVKSGSQNTSAPKPDPLPVYDPVTLNFTGTCASRTDVEIRPSMYVFYRKSGSDSPFQYLGFIDKGTVTVTALVKGEAYDFQVNYGGQNYGVSQLIDQNSFALNMDMGNSCNDF